MILLKTIMHTGQMIEYKYHKNKFNIYSGDQLKYKNGGLQFQISSVTKQWLWADYLKSRKVWNTTVL